MFIVHFTSILGLTTMHTFFVCEFMCADSEKEKQESDSDKERLESSRKQKSTRKVVGPSRVSTYFSW